MIKRLDNKLGTERYFLNTIKALYEKHTTDITFNEEGLKTFPWAQEKAKGTHLCCFYSTFPGSSSKSN